MPAALRRTAAVARATARDLGVECGGTFVFFAALLMLAVLQPTHGENEASAARAEVYQRLVAVIWFSVFVIIFAGTWSVTEDRRSGRLAQWMTSPLKPWEYVIGKWLGVGAGAFVLLLGLDLITLAWASQGIIQQEELFGPRRSVLATEFSGGDQPVVAVRSGQEVEFVFTELPDASQQSFEFSVRGIAYERYGQDSAPPSLVMKSAAGEILLAEDLPRLPAQRARFPVFAEDSSLPITVTFRAGHFVGGRLIVDRARFGFLSAPQSSWIAFVRSLGGVFLVLQFALAGALLSAVFLADVVAFFVTGACLAVALGRTVLLEITATVADSADHYSELVVMVSSWAAGLLRLLPDLPAIAGARTLVEGRMPFSAADPLPWPAALAWILAMIVLASIALATWRRWFPERE